MDKEFYMKVIAMKIALLPNVFTHFHLKLPKIIQHELTRVGSTECELTYVEVISGSLRRE